MNPNKKLLLQQFYINILLIFLLSFRICFSQEKIMPLGNSITQGIGSSFPYSGYRKYLYNLLNNNGVNIDFVGSLQDGDPFQFDVNHEGHPGWYAQEIDAHVNGWLNDDTPNSVLLHIGTNDISHVESNQDNINEIESIVNKIYSYNSQTKILVCSIIPRKDDKNNKTIELNVLIYQLVNQKIGEGYNIYFIDQYSAFTSNGNWQNEYMSDYLHPNDNGYYLMAVTFFNVLKNILYPSFYSISGNVIYYANSNPINDVIVDLSGGYFSSFNTEFNGFYEFDNLVGFKNYTIQPYKNKIDRTENDIITMYNAALALRHAVGVEILSSNSLIAADVDKSGDVLAFDAALIARYVVGLPQFENDHAGEWIFLPSQRNYQELQSNHYAQNFEGILLGDVFGGWEQNTLVKPQQSKFAWLTNIDGKIGETITLPFSFFEDSLLSLEIELDYPDDIIDFVSVKELHSDKSFKLLLNDNSGKIKLGLFSSKFFTINGKLLDFNFIIKENINPVNSEFYLNKLQINNKSIENGISILNISGDELNKFTVKVFDNYPNPFNPNTIISYNIGIDGFVKINIYNMLGQHIKTLLNEKQSSGLHKIIWDGSNEFGIRVANGMYIYRVSFKNQIINKTMIKLE